MVEQTGHVAVHVEVIFVLTMAKIAVLLEMNLAGVLPMDIMSLQIRLEHLVGLIAFQNTVNLQSISAALPTPLTDLAKCVVTIGASLLMEREGMIATQALGMSHATVQMAALDYQAKRLNTKVTLTISTPVALEAPM